MKSTENKISRYLTAAVVLLAAPAAYAQALPSDPWAAQEQQVQQQQYQQPVQQQSASPTIADIQTGATTATVVQVQQVGPVIYGSQPYQPTYEGGDSNIWNTKMPEFTGEMTTWGDDYGQRVRAPEVNMHNILSITQHLRNMGYQIPDSFEAKVKAAPEGVRKRINKALVDLKRNDDPFSKSAQFVKMHFENETGMTFENLIGNSLDLISAK